MKKSFLIIIFGVFSMALSININAQEKANNDSLKNARIHGNNSNNELQLKAIKEARKEAKKLIKEGFQTSDGKLPLDKQLENAWQKQVEVDADGNPYWYIASSKATGNNKESTILDATHSAKNDLAEQIQTNITQLINVNSNMGQAAANLSDIVADSKSTISATLNRIIPLVEIYRTLPDNNVEVYVTFGYSYDAANQAAVKAIRTELVKSSKSLAKELDKLGY